MTIALYHWLQWLHNVADIYSVDLPCNLMHLLIIDGQNITN